MAGGIRPAAGRCAAGALEKIEAQLTEDLGDHPDNVFAKVEHEPLAAASLGQVHRAWLDDGTVLALKVRRPGISRVVEADLRLLDRLAELLGWGGGGVRGYWPGVVGRRVCGWLGVGGGCGCG